MRCRDTSNAMIEVTHSRWTGPSDVTTRTQERQGVRHGGKHAEEVTEKKRGVHDGIMRQHQEGAAEQMERGYYNFFIKLKIPSSVRLCSIWKSLCLTRHTCVDYVKFKWHTRLRRIAQMLHAVKVELRQIL